jgi:hypothetical protein
MNCGAQNLLLVTHDKDWDAEVLWRKRERYWPEATAQMVRWSLQCAGWVGMTDYLEYLAARVGHVMLATVAARLVRTCVVGR